MFGLRVFNNREVRLIYRAERAITISPDAHRNETCAHVESIKAKSCNQERAFLSRFTYRYNITLEGVIKNAPKSSSGLDFVQKSPEGTGVPDAQQRKTVG